jgi:hypothetical protein
MTIKVKTKIYISYKIHKERESIYALKNSKIKFTYSYQKTTEKSTQACIPHYNS